MKKATTKKTSNVKRTVKTPVVRASALKETRKNKQDCFNPWSLSIYVYWFIILFFIAATFYILGRSHNILNVTPHDVLAEEALIQSNDYYESGKTKLFDGKIDDAITDLTASIDANSDSVVAYITRGEAYMQSGNYEKAMNDFNAAIEKDENNAVAYYSRCLLNARLENYQAALNDINMALQLVATTPNENLTLRDLYAKRGQLNLWLKNWEGAIADYTNSLARPEGVVTPDVYAERAEAYTAIGQYAAAVEDYKSATRVISEQIHGTVAESESESLLNHAIGYFEKSAALNLNLGNIDAARTDLASAHAIAFAQNDIETVERLQSLIDELSPVDTANAQ